MTEKLAQRGRDRSFEIGGWGEVLAVSCGCKLSALKRMEDFSPRPEWRPSNMLFEVRNGALTRKDVKNED
jgi:hypothetical protein